MALKQLIINPGSTSTKLAVYEDENKLFQETIEHSNEELMQFAALPDQVPYRLKLVKEFLAKHNVALADLDGIMGRGGMVRGIGTGGWKVDDDLVTALGSEKYCSPHASLLGGLMGHELAVEAGITAYIYDPVTGAKLPLVAKTTGYPEIVKQSTCHVLNSRAMAMRFAKENDMDYNEINVVVAHMGGGISLSAHKAGTIVDSVGDDEGPMSPERAGGAPLLDFLKLCFSGEYSEAELKKKVRGKGGMAAYLGTSDARTVEDMAAAGNETAKLLYDTIAYQVAKAVGQMAVALKGDVKGIILTGGLAYSKMLTSEIAEYVESIAPVIVMPGENEMEALALGGLRILKGEEEAQLFELKEA